MNLSLLLCSLLLFAPLQDPTTYSAVVTSSEATFAIPVKPRERWNWRLRDTRDNQQEYRMDVSVKNESNEYTFGFYLWKRSGSSPGSGSLDALLSTGQKSLFERAESRLMTIVRGADVKVKRKGDVVVIMLRGKKDLERLFSSKPAEVVLKVKIPGDADIAQTVPVVYQ